MVISACDYNMNYRLIVSVNYNASTIIILEWPLFPATIRTLHSATPPSC